MLGCGFWADYQIAAWKELHGVELVALYNRTRSKAETLANKYGVPSCYEDAAELLDREELDFVDIITDVDTHSHFTQLAAARNISVICQKPMAPGMHEAKSMLEDCRSRKVALYIHENFRWQTPIRQLKKLLDESWIGRPFKAQVSFCSNFPVFDNQPFLRDLDRFILTDIGSHLLDVTRFLFGEANTLYCQTTRVNPLIKGEDVACVTLQMANGMLCYVEMSYASIRPAENFPQTLILVEGELGSLTLGADYNITLASRSGSFSKCYPPTIYSWSDPLYAPVHASIVDCNRNLLQALQGIEIAETTGDDNFETVRLVWCAYSSAEQNRALQVKQFQP